MKSRFLVTFAVVAGAVTTAGAVTFDCRFVERVGNTDQVLPGNSIDASNGQPRRIRMQFCVLDDGSADGGLLGQQFGTLTVGGTAANSDETRTPGRLQPFNFSDGARANGNPPLPNGDPFTMLSDIDNTLGTQTPVWVCAPNGSVPEQPSAVIRGLGDFISIFEFTIDPNDGFSPYTVTAGGMLLGATVWSVIGVPVPPYCGAEDPDDNHDGRVVWVPEPTERIEYTCALTVVPAPSTAALLGFAGLCLAKRHRE